VAGETETLNFVGRRVTGTLPDFTGFARLCAITCTVSASLNEAGAVYTPVLETVPIGESSAQVTAELDAPVTVAVNACVCDSFRVAAAGATETATVESNMTTACANFVLSSMLVAVI
jgi:hypothetical protein